MDTIDDFRYILLFIQICQFKNEGLAWKSATNRRRQARYLWKAFLTNEDEKVIDIIRMSEIKFWGLGTGG